NPITTSFDQMFRCSKTGLIIIARHVRYMDIIIRTIEKHQGYFIVKQQLQMAVIPPLPGCRHNDPINATVDKRTNYGGFIMNFVLSYIDQCLVVLRSCDQFNYFNCLTKELVAKLRNDDCDGVTLVRSQIACIDIGTEAQFLSHCENTRPSSRINIVST